MTLLETLIILSLGLAFGSFITCMSYRWPRDLEWVKTPSFCPGCNATLKAKDLFPVFSWLFSSGKCRYCANPISVRYPAIEIINTLSFFLIYQQYGLSMQTAILCVLSVMLLIMIVVDFAHYIIPDQVHIVLTPLGLYYHYTLGTDWGQVLAGFLTLAGLGLFLHYGYGRIRKKDVLGFGDVKFFAVAGVWLTFANVLPYIFAIGAVGTIMGIIWKLSTKHAIYPFGPSLAVTLWLFLVYPAIPNALWNLVNPY